MNIQQTLVHLAQNSIPSAFGATNATILSACSSICKMNAIPLPLLPDEVLNPCFVTLSISIIYTTLAVFIAFQIFQILFNNYCGPYRIKYGFGSAMSIRSVGLCHFIKLILIFSQLIFAGLLLGINSDSYFDFKTISIITFIISALFLAVPLHLLEPERAIVPLASLLIFWTANIIISGMTLLHDVAVEEKIYQLSTSSSLSNSFSITAQSLLFANAILVLYFELYLYNPTTELIEYFDLNEWDYSSMRDLYSEVSISWLQPTMKQIYEKNELTGEICEKLPIIPPFLEANYTTNNLSKEWKAQQNKHGKKASMLIPLLSANASSILFAYIFNLADIVLSFTQPFLLQKLLLNFTQGAEVSNTSSPPTSTVAYLIILAMFSASISRLILANRCTVCIFNVVFKIKSSVSSMIYEKALKLSPESRKEKTTGDIINHLSTDVLNLEDISELINELINNPLRLVFCISSLYSIIGNAAWGGVLIALILVPLSSKVSTSMWLLHVTGLGYKDERVRLTSEILNSIKSIKLYSWEKPMLERLDEIRNGKELVNKKRVGINDSISTFLWSCIPFFISCASFATFVFISKTPLTPEIAFPALTLFDMICDPFLMIPHNFSKYLEVKASLKRISEFFSLEELESPLLTRTYAPLQPNDVSIDVNNAIFLWKNESTSSDVNPDNIALSNINFTARKGQLTCIVGKVGSGKSTFIKALLGEIPIQTGDPSTNFTVNGSIAYCSQTPWILNATVKENILFGFRYEKDFYERTIQVCELLEDFKSLPDGDKTVVGEKGISLSGGQKARISLARAVYSRADIYILDDVLSAVDSHVGKNIISNVLSQSGILATKSIILASNSINVLSEADSLFLINFGKITESGTFTEVMKNPDSQLCKLIMEYGRNETSINQEKDNDLSLESRSLESNKIEAYEPEIGSDILDTRGRRQSIGQATLDPFDKSEIKDNGVLNGQEPVGEDGLKVAIASKTTQEEESRAKGYVKLKYIMEFFKACNYTYVVFYLSLTFGTIVSSVLSNYLLKYWSELNDINRANTDTAKFLLSYTLLGVLGAAFTLVGGFVLWTCCILRGSRVFHDKMARSVLRSPMSFFETTPVGRVLNRFSGDISVIGSGLPWLMIELLESVLKAGAVLGVIIINLPPMAIIVFILMFCYNEIRKFFGPIAREFPRLQAIKKSPVISHLQELVNGVETLRAYSQQDRFIHRGRKNLDDKIQIDFLMQMCNRWLALRLQLISAILLLSSGIAITLTKNTEYELSAGLVGFVMTYVLSITTLLTIIIRRYSDVESKSVSIERIIEYCNLPSEDLMIKEDNRPPVSWPRAGGISFKGYSTKYRENLDPILRNISFDIKPGEKIGIVGRTGAGKSSLTLAIFRIIEATTGSINIDGYNTSEIGLFDLRSNLSIIPQDSQTVEGSVRQNLDPFGRFEDEKLWKVLELAHLKDHIQSMKTEQTIDKNAKEVGETLYALDAKVYEGGSNLSSGQKQLLCLARALLNPSKILILDEATAAVDVETDKIIQETIRNEFKEKTILTIAHRLDTIMDSDRVIVLDKGEIKEFATVDELLAMKKGIFRLLSEKGGYIKIEKDD